MAIFRWLDIEGQHGYIYSIFWKYSRPKSVRNRCVIEIYGGIFVLSSSFF